MSKKISSEMIEQLKNPTYEMTSDIMEMSLDGFIENDIVKNIPIIKWFKLSYDIMGYFKKQRMAKNIILFLESYQKGNLSNEEKQIFFDSFEKSEKVVEIIFLRLEEIIEEDKSKLLALLLEIIIKKDIDAVEFIYLSDLLLKIRASEYKMMSQLFAIKKETGNSYLNQSDSDRKILKRLNNLGLLEERVKIPMTAGYSAPNYSYRLNYEGEILGEMFYRKDPSDIRPD